MTADNIQSAESFESIVVVEISSQTDAIVETEMADETDEVKRETKALIAALKKRAQSEAESAGTISRETYLNIVRQARETIEGKKILQGDRLEYTWAVVQDEAEKNWYLLMKEVTEFSGRVQKAVKAGWEAFNEPHSQR
ncbi:hypothetical protein [Calothrix sp. PCC 7507]|uniref:hypothetical protein n=1 Tax=Calothrix sp. PCC 7507 TaxID=99598 RepID=UPI00029F386B|nr:hypothetical protein [Calothrix sp. PCC 7507]AFY32952.1 hypothetical protein Cal7507_2524 [Calothrix sp. PCC 7507]